MDDAALDALCDAAFDFLMGRHVGELIDADQIVQAVHAAGAPDKLSGVLVRFVAPARQRLLERALKSTLKLAVWVPEPTREVLATALGQPVRIPKKVIDELVASERTRDAVRSMLQEAITSVVDKAFSAAPGNAGKGLRGMIGFGARAAGAAGRAMFGGLGDELQRQLEERMRDFVDIGVGLVLKRLAQRLASEETAQQLGKRRRAVFLDAMERTESETARLLARVTWPMLDALTPMLVAHNLARAEVREALAAEVQAALDEGGRQTLGELLDTLGLREHARTVMRTRGAPLLRAFLQSAEYGAWSARR